MSSFQQSWSFRWSGTALMIAGAAMLLAAQVFSAEPADNQPANNPAGSFVIPAYAFDRGNPETFTASWADAEPMVAFGGQSPVTVEYDIDFPLATQYTLHICYAAAKARPVELYVDGERVAQVCRTATGSWNTSGAQWEAACTLTLTQGKHTIRLVRADDFPHVVSLRFDTAEKLPADWKLHRPTARKLTSPSGLANAAGVNVQALRLAIVDLIETYGPRYPRGAEFLKRLDDLEAKLDKSADNTETTDALEVLRREALLANPLLDFDQLLLVQRGVKSPSLGLPRNWESNSSLPKSGFDDQLVTLSPINTDGQLATVFKPSGGRFVGDVDLHFDGDKMLISMPGDNGRWQVFELRTDGTGLRQLTGEEPDVDNYDACYLPSGKIIFTSTACFSGVPCVYGNSHVANLYLMDGDGQNIRQLCFDQEHNWCPTVLNDGRVLYSRWEYTDTPHSNTRLLFQMNPDGTEQRALYGGNSYWPNSFFYTRPIPGHASKVVSVIGGHHDNPRMGELVVFDTAQGRQEADGAIQRIPGRDLAVEPIIRDGLTRNSWPKFLHPYPLSEKYFLVSCKPSPQALWGIYLVDVFDNITLVKELPGYALLEPIPLRKTTTPPTIADKVDLRSKSATYYIADIYAGDGLTGIPRGTVKEMRVFTYHYAYQGMGGLLGIIGMDGPWDIKRVIGTVPVQKDGSIKFQVPANTPISLQPLDEEGKALQLMRSWTTAMPGETVSCTGCHQRSGAAPARVQTLAEALPASEIKPWYGPTRGFNYAREVQPVIDRHCVGCHNGEPQPDGSSIANLRGDVKVNDWSSVTPGNGGYSKAAGKFSVGYAELHRFVRRPGIESDYHVLEPMEFHADTTELVQMLKKGHHNVQLDAEDWDRLITWIDLNCPFHGTWGEELDNPGKQRQRRNELLLRYAGIDDDPEAVPQLAAQLAPQTAAPPAVTAAAPPQDANVTCPNWPLDAEQARARQLAAGATTEDVDLGDGISLRLTRIPAGEFVMGSLEGAVDERPLSRVRIAEPFWIGTLEVTNAQFAKFNAAHDSRVESKNTYQFGIHGYPMNQPEQPVVRVSWNEATAFCRWLSEKTGRQFSLPTEAQWEYACRAGTATPLSFGEIDSDFSSFANLADAKLTEFASDPYTVDSPLKSPTKYDDWIPKESRYNDGALLSVQPGKYHANAWGLCDMHGNVSEWTRTTYKAYPYDAADGRDEPQSSGRKVARGGSWRDRPQRATSSFRLSYQPYQRVYNVGFRVVCETPAQPETIAADRESKP
jgi:formylglycine-generating enzyme required for sulfatase activity